MQPTEPAYTEVPLSVVLLMLFHDGNADDSSCINIARPQAPGRGGHKLRQ